MLGLGAIHGYGISAGVAKLGVFIGVFVFGFLQNPWGAGL